MSELDEHHYLVCHQPHCAVVMNELAALTAERDLYKEAVMAVDIYFKALNKQWNANDGRVVSESGVVLNGSADVERLCNVAALKVQSALSLSPSVKP